MNEKFFNLPQEKQAVIINAALYVFAKNSYKKASTDEITRRAGISKGLLFHYFESKKGLYLYLYKYAETLLIEEMRRFFDYAGKDFFEVLVSAQKAKIQVLRRHPDLMTFLINAYLESDDAVEIQMDINFREIIAASRDQVLTHTDTHKFKEGVNAAQVLDIILWMSEGFMHSRTPEQLQDLEAVNDDFLSHMDLLRKQFYKEEFL